MKRKRIVGQVVAGIAFFILSGSSRLLAQEEGTGFYLSAQTAFFSGLTFPASYDEGAPVGGDPTGYMSLRTTTSLSSRVGLGLALGYRSGAKWLWLGGEVEFAMATAPNGAEILWVPVRNDWGYVIGNAERSFTQSGRKISVFGISLVFGTFPFESFDLGFNAAIGVGYGRHIFQSEAAIDAESRGISIEYMNGGYEFDFGNYDGGGTWTKGSLLYVVGFGSEFKFSRCLSVRLDYRYAAGFLTRDMPVGSYAYVPSVHYSYTMGNKLMVGLNFRI
ncbi:MAG: hypothetical protein WCB96_10715 [Candidatus Aminicenantales bacterium]